MLFTDTCTIYNHYIEDDVDKWKKSILKGVQWSHNKVESSVSGTSITQTRVESITIDFGKDYGNDTYIDSNAFHDLEDKTGYWTLENHEKLDVMVLGEGSDITDLSELDNFQYRGTVSTISDNRNRDFLKTIKVTLK